MNSRKKLESEQFLISWLDKMDDAIVKAQLVELKKDAKKVAFLTKDIKHREFFNVYLEVNACYSFKFADFGRSTDFYIWFALKTSIELSRTFYVMKTILCQKMRSLWQK